METEHYSNPPGWIIVLYGVLLSFIVAFTPFFDAGYHLNTQLLFAGILPYMVYAIAVPLFTGAITTSVGVALAVAHTSLVMAVRVFGSSDSLLFSIPLLLAVLMIPLVIVALMKSHVHDHQHHHRTIPH